MSRSKNQSVANPVSLFPFLAVLICTMGTLILLLIVITRNVKTQQIAEHSGDRPEQVTRDLENEAGMTEAMIKGLQESRKLTQEQIEQERAKIATFEKQTEKLSSDIDRTVKFLEIRDREKPLSHELELVRETLRQKQSELATLEGEFQKLQQEHVEGGKSYAIIPYKGHNGTFKRPVYIECTGDQVIVQPEGIILTEMDFALGSHLDNPLDAAIRAAYQYYVERGLVETGSEPYPLLVVRPNGIDAYYAVREALRSWNDNFGYELVDGDWSMEYPIPNQELKQEIVKQVDTARMRMIPVMNAMLERQMRGSGMKRGNIARGGAGGTGNGKSSEITGRFVETGSGPEVGSEARSAVGSESASPQQSGMGDSMLTMQQMQQGGMPGGENFATNSGIGQPQNSTSQNTFSSEATSQESSADLANNLFMRKELESESGEVAKRSIEQIWANPNAPRSVESAPSYADDFVQTQRRPFQKMPQDTPQMKKQPENWALRNTGNGTSAITRNIPLTCYPDKLVFSRASGKGINKEIPISQNVSATGEDFAQTVWKYIDTWGDAGSTMFWRPVLKVNVAPGAEAQFEELKSMLNGSGLKVERTQTF